MCIRDSVVPVWLTMVRSTYHMLYIPTRDYTTPKHIAAHTLLWHTVTLQAVMRTAVRACSLITVIHAHGVMLGWPKVRIELTARVACSWVIGSWLGWVSRVFRQDERHESENERKRARTSDISDVSKDSNSRYISDISENSRLAQLATWASTEPHTCPQQLSTLLRQQ